MNDNPMQPLQDLHQNVNFRYSVSPPPGNRYGLGEDPNGFVVHTNNHATEPNSKPKPSYTNKST